MANMGKTILGLMLEVQSTTVVDSNYLATVTLNAKYGVSPALLPQAQPRIRYFGAGIGGAKNIDSENLSGPFKPQATDMDLYKALPIRCVPLANDLTAADRANYRMRQVKQINGIQYALYWLKVMTPLDTKVQITRTDPVSKQETPYVLDPANLNPVPPPLSTDGTVGSATAEINVTTSYMVNLTGNEIMEAINVLYGGDTRRAMITELGYYYGEDRVVKGESATSAQFDYTEAIMTMLGYHYCFNGQDFSEEAAVMNRTVRIGKSDVALL